MPLVQKLRARPMPAADVLKSEFRRLTRKRGEAQYFCRLCFGAYKELGCYAVSPDEIEAHYK